MIHVIDVCTHIGFLHRHRIDIDIDIDIDINIDIDIVSAWSQPEFGARDHGHLCDLMGIYCGVFKNGSETVSSDACTLVFVIVL